MSKQVIAEQGTLHVLPYAPSAGDAFNLALMAIANHDCLLLVGDAVYTLLNLPQSLASLQQQNRLYALAEDVQARGLSSDEIPLVDYAQFVSLSAQYQRVCTW